MPPELSTRPRLAATAVLALLGAAAFGLFLYPGAREGADITVGGAAAGEEELRNTYAELCRTRSLAESQVEGARDLFFRRVHPPLHVLARSVEDVDRTVAARLLEAKNDVERAFNEDAPAADTAAALDRLLIRTAQGLRSVEVTTSTCEFP